MNPNPDAILQAALALSEEQRIALVTRLVESLPAPTPSGTESATELLNELRRRSAALRAGETSARFASDVLDDLRRKHTRGVAQ
jgi:putative addiction module component (TIGR02574 family)